MKLGAKNYRRRIAICAPATPITRDMAQQVSDLAEDFPQLSLVFHEQCFASEGHFAGNDTMRLGALLECANDPGVDAVWFAKGGYGSNRIAEQGVLGMGDAAQSKAYLGYSDCGYLLAALYRNKIGQAVHAPMPSDIARDEGEGAVRRVLAYLSGDDEGLEPSLAKTKGTPVVAFNLMTLAMLVGTDLMPDLSGHEVMVEEVSEHHYAVDRLFFHICQHLGDIAGLRLGRVSHVPQNDRAFGAEPTEIAQYWCKRSGIPFLGNADIGHDVGNKIVPFGRLA